MAAKYWLKLYYEMLDDPKIGQMRPALRWRFVECMLVAGECDDGGLLPESAELAWRVRADAERLDTELHELAEAGVLSRVDGRWLVTNFAKRQAPVSGAERVSRFRDRQKKDEYHTGDTGPLRDGNDTVTKRYTDTDTDKIRGDKIQRREEASPSPNGRELVPMVNALVEATGMSGHLNWDTLAPLADDLMSSGYEPAQVIKAYGPDGWWQAEDWRGKQGQRPTCKQVRESVREATSWNGKSDIRQLQPEPFDNRMKGLEEALENEGLA